MQVEFDYHLYTNGPDAMSRECEAQSLAANAYEGLCWKEYR